VAVATRAAAENVAWFGTVLSAAGVPGDEALRRANVCWSAYLMVAELMASDDPAAIDAAINDKADLLVDLLVTPRPDTSKRIVPRRIRRRS